MKLLYWMIWVFLTVDGCHLICDYKFTFPNVTGAGFIVQDNAEIVLPFHFLSTCGIPDDFTVKVARRHREPFVTRIVCHIAHINGTCYSQKQAHVNCACMEELGKYLLTKVAEQSDNTTWVFWKDRDDESRTLLVFHVTGGSFPAPKPSSSLINFPDTTSQSQKWVDFASADHTSIQQFEEVDDPDDVRVKDTTPSDSRSPYDVPTTDMGPGIGVIVISCVGIVAIAATVTIIAVFAIKGKRKRDSKRDSQAQDNDGESQDRPATPPYNLYWEIQDDSPPPSPGAEVFPMRQRKSLPVPPGAAAEEAPAIPEVELDDGYLTPVPTRKTKSDAPVCSPPAPGAVPDDGYLTPVPSRRARTGAVSDQHHTLALLSSEDNSESYERPANPDYTTPNSPYEPLRHLYETVGTKSEDKSNPRPRKLTVQTHERL